MINLDAYILEFIKNNYVTIGFALGLLKVLAQESNNNIDDKIITYINNWFGLSKKDKNGGNTKVN